jgi:hypothetical protein
VFADLAPVVIADRSITGGDDKLIPRRWKVEIEDGDGGRGKSMFEI